MTEEFDIKVSELDSICLMAQEVKKKIEEHEEIIGGYREQLKLYEQRLLSYLEHLGKDGWSFEGGAVEIRTRTTVKLPKDEGDKRAFFSWLRERGIFDEVIGVNSNTLNALYRSEQEACLQEGRPCEIPGLSQPTEYSQVIIKTRK